MNLYIIMGVSGSGKTTIGQRLSEKTGIPFYDADDYHPQANVKKMERGESLDDQDRGPWLELLNINARQWLENGDAILACSALKESYRVILTNRLSNCQWIVLTAEYDTIAGRLNTRKGHFFNPVLLTSQFDALEVPHYGWHFDAATPAESIIRNILARMEMSSGIGIIGMGVMGQNLALNFIDHGFRVSVFNRVVKGSEESVAADFVSANEGDQLLQGFDGDLKTFISTLAKPRRILLMVKAGAAVDSMIKDLSPFLEEDDILIDGGNSHFMDTSKRAESLKAHGIRYLGMGISGGKEGARHGPSMMPGGAFDAYAYIGPMIESVAAKDEDGRPCCAFIGPEGAGHYVKMVHNGIEYAEMQLITEVHQILRRQKLSHTEIADVLESWTGEEADSYLLGITIEILRTTEANLHLVDRILDVAGHKGTGVWAAQNALDLGIPIPTITGALTMRQTSGQRQARLKVASIYRMSQAVEVDPDILCRAYHTARVLNHVIGFELLKAASREYGYNLHLAELARIWTNGCIIRSSLMRQFEQILGSDHDHLLIHPEIVGRLTSECSSLTTVVASAMTAGLPVPALCGAVNYFNAMSSSQVGARLIQAQRDYFGQHGFQRIDSDPGQTHHGPW